MLRYILLSFCLFSTVLNAASLRVVDLRCENMPTSLGIGGKKIGDHCLDPGWTAYSKQVLYSTYDVTELIEAGDNSIGVVLGNSFFNLLPMRIFNPLRAMLRIGRPCPKAQLIYDINMYK